MLAIIGVISVHGLIILIEFTHLKDGKIKKDSLVFGLFLLISATFSIILALDINIPTPFDWLMMLFKPINNWIDNMSLG